MTLALQKPTSNPSREFPWRANPALADGSDTEGVSVTGKWKYQVGLKF
jgi:hypothetical protein